MGRVRSYLVVVAPPALKHATGLCQTGECFFAQALVAEPADEVFTKKLGSAQLRFLGTSAKLKS
jgi:hypothetical protein